MSFRIAEIERYELALPLAEPFTISGGTMNVRRSLVVVLHDGEGHQGFGESPPFELPFYSGETLGSARLLLEEVLVPRLVGREVEGPEEVDAILRGGVRGNPFARAALETAAWDLEAHRRGTGIAQLLAARLGVTPAARIACGVALGIPADRSPRTLQRWIEQALGHGYRRVKIKVAPGWDAEPVAGACEVLHGSGIPLTVDANGAYEWPRHEAGLRALDAAEPLYIEQPLAPDELVGHVALGRALRTPVCVDETLHDARWARQLAELAGPRVWNVKVHRMGGLTEVCRVYRIAGEYGAELWAGTMPESGLGSQAALAAAALPGFVYPSDLEPSTRWFGPGVDVIELRMHPDGTMDVPDRSIASRLDPDAFRRASRRLH